MNRTLRFVIAAGLLLGIVFLARNQVAWAINSPSQESLNPDSGVQSAPLSAPQNPGSVRPPSPVVIPVTSGTYSVGGVCTLNVLRLEESMSLMAELLEFDVLDERPEDITRYLAGVCALTYRKSGELIIEMSASDGEVEICFADVPTSTNQVFVFDDEAWTALETTVENGLKCAAASKTGKYVLGEIP